MSAAALDDPIDVGIVEAINSVSLVASYAVLTDAIRAGKDSATWPRLSPGEARNIKFALLDAYEAMDRVRVWIVAVADIAQTPGADPEAFMVLVGKGASTLTRPVTKSEARP